MRNEVEYIVILHIYAQCKYTWKYKQSSHIGVLYTPYIHVSNSIYMYTNVATAMLINNTSFIQVLLTITVSQKSPCGVLDTAC